MQSFDFPETSSKLTTENTYMLTIKFYYQPNICTKGSSFSVTFSNICLKKLETEKVKTKKPLFCKQFVNDILNRNLIPF